MAFLSKIGQWVLMTVGELVVRYVIDHYTAWMERRKRMEEQKKKDEVLKKPYVEAVKNGTKEEIKQATEDRFNT
jgi:hypothetical protein